MLGNLLQIQKCFEVVMVGKSGNHEEKEANNTTTFQCIYLLHGPPDKRSYFIISTDKIFATQNLFKNFQTKIHII